MENHDEYFEWLSPAIVLFFTIYDQQKAYRDAYERKTLQKILCRLVNDDFKWD